VFYACCLRPPKSGGWSEPLFLRRERRGNRLSAHVLPPHLPVLPAVRPRRESRPLRRVPVLIARPSVPIARPAAPSCARQISQELALRGSGRGVNALG
jgi:hypothetical protein